VLTDIQTGAFERDGYAIVEGVLQPDLLARIRAEADALAATEPVETERRVWHERVLFRRQAFRDLLDVKPLVENAEALQGADVQLLALDLLLVRDGSDGIGWHRDVQFVCNKTLSINTGIYLQDLTDDVGPLRVLPGSHRVEDGPDVRGSDPIPGERTVYAKAGDAVFFDAALLHAGGCNTSGADRLAVFPYFGRYWVKRMDNYFTQPLPADLAQTDDPMKRQLLGLDLRPGVPSYHGDGEGYNRGRGEAGVDFPND
jgi:ectoine hydroxylase-related dioxygenase (phytanoyl-CoA dioxygenase family)